MATTFTFLSSGTFTLTGSHVGQSVTIQCYGAGGRGSNAGNGGSGGAYSKIIKVLPTELMQDMTTTSGLFPKLPADLFYPLTVQSDSFAINRAISLIMVVVFSLSCLFF